MNVVDSSGWLEYLAKGKNSSYFAPIVRSTDSLLVPTVCIYEVFNRLLVQRGEDTALDGIGVMSLGVIVELTRDIAVNAAALSAELRLAMADSVILATARSFGAILWTQDADFAGIDGVQYIESR